ncbi:DUF4815 domain-containing protein [bacterium]|nr:DUF4815 domain-containing protein [bacterium]
MPSPTDFNLSPYYDDFNESKKFHRILFRPSFAVQARELTQSQSILQNQVERVSDHLFEKGAMVIPGEIGYNINYYAVKLTSFTDSAAVGVTLTDFVGLQLTGTTSGVVAKVINQVATDGTDPNTLYVQYETSGTNNTSTSFTDGETISVSTTLQSVVTTVSAVVDTTATGAAAYVAEGTYYINGFHVNVAEQTILLDKYTNTPSYRVGLLVTESFVTPNDDLSLNDNAQGTSNVNAPGAHRFKIDLTLTKKSLTATDDANFVELLRLKAGILQNQVRTTDYAVLEDTLARRTFDESGDYAVRDFDLDIREHLKTGNNRGIYTSANGGLETKLALGLGAGKAYVKGFEIETIGTRFIDLNKARDFDTQNNFTTKFDVGNFVNVTNIFGVPDVGFVSGSTEAFKRINLYDTLTSSRGTENSGSGASITSIGRAKSKGFQYVTGSASAFTFASSSLTSAIYRHYMFDINMFTHLNVTSNTAFTTGETITGSTSNATGTVESLTTATSATISGATKANPGVVTATGHGLKEGQQVTIASVGGMTQLNGNVYTVRNPGTNDFELYGTDGISSVDSSAYGTYTSGGTATHGVVVLSSTNGTFVAGETITGGTSSNTAIIQADAVGLKGVRQYDFSATKQIGMAGSPAYTADVSRSSSYGESLQITGNITVANSSASVTGFGTLFNTELKVGDEITISTDAGGTVTKIVEAIISNTSLTLSSAVGGSDVSTKSVATRNRAKLQDSNKNVSIFKLPNEAVKTLKTTSNSGITDTNFKVRRQFVQQLSSGSGQISAGTNETFASLAEGDFTVSIKTINSASSGANGDILSLSGNNGNSNPIFTLSGSPTGKTLDLDFGTAYADAELKIIATVNRSVAGSKTKTLNSASTLAVSTQATIESGTIGLAKADIYQINSVYMAPDFSTAATTSHTDITSRFELDTGQRDNFYDIGRIKLKTGELTPTGRLLVNFDYFSHGSGDYFDVDSYSGVVNYVDIPEYKSDTTGQTFQLRDCLDFRPRVDDASTINSGGQDRSFDGTGASTVDVVKFGDDVTTDFEYYLSRIDKVFLDKDGDFKVVEGASSLDPQLPKTLDGAMHLYTLSLAPYTLSTEEIEIETVDNRRYTMRDIGRLEKRIENVEYYTQLSLLETQTQQLQIQDADGFDRFKNGFIVDNFTGHGIGDVGNLDYRIAMDMASGEARPICKTDSIQLIEADDDGTAILSTDRTDNNYAKTGDLITLPYSEQTLIDQPFASKFLNVNPFNVFTWVGTIELDPAGDEWKETERVPELVVNQQGMFDTMAANLGNPNLAEIQLGTVWNEWQENWVGRPVESGTRNIGGQRREQTFARGVPRRVLQTQEITTTQQVNQTRTGVRSVFVPQVVRRSMGDRILNVAFIPFIRSRTVNFTGTRFKPSTRVYPFFENIDISSYVTPTGGSLGGNLVSDANGALSGSFAIPDPTVDANPRWRTGTRVFRLTSSSSNDLNSEVETAGEGDYSASGSLETVRETIVSTREPRIVRENTTENRTIARTSTRRTDRQVGWWDPLAQTFLVDDKGGVFVTSLDVYFQSKPEAGDSQVPVTLQVREVKNGYPSTNILPFSEVSINPTAVTTSTDASIATTFTFPSPVFIQENTEYAFVLLANSQEYNVYVSRVGQTNLGSDRTISAQPYAGVLFKSQNGSTWTAEQNEDIKFKMKRAEFENVTGNVTLVNDTLPSKSLKANPLRTTSGSDVIRVFHNSHGMHGTSNNVTISGLGASTTYNGITGSSINGTYTSISNVTLDSYDIQIADSSTATSSGDMGGSLVVATQNRLYDVSMLNIQTMTVPDTNIGYSIRPTSGKSIHGSETEFSLTSTTNKVNVVANDNIYFEAPNMVASDINQTNEMSGSKSLFVNCTLTTSNTKVSPVIDTQRISMIAVQNRLNSPTSSNTPDFKDDEQSSGSSSAAIYCTRPIVLDTPSTSLEVRLTSNVRASAEVEVYFRGTSAEEVRDIKDLSWTPFNGDGSEDTTVAPAESNNQFKEYKYSASAVADFTAFQIKVVMKGTNSAHAPRIKDLRGIALAV